MTNITIPREFFRANKAQRDMINKIYDNVSLSIRPMFRWAGKKALKEALSAKYLLEKDDQH